MRLVNKDKLLPPGKCVVCETKPNGRVVDTQFKNFRNTAADPMRGRKYVCDRCGSKIAEALAYPSPSKVADMEAIIARLRQENEALVKASDNANILQELKDYIEGQKRALVLDD